jgi:hypothetical protein
MHTNAYATTHMNNNKFSHTKAFSKMGISKNEIKTSKANLYTIITIPTSAMYTNTYTNYYTNFYQKTTTHMKKHEFSHTIKPLTKWASPKMQ